MLSSLTDGVTGPDKLLKCLRKLFKYRRLAIDNTQRFLSLGLTTRQALELTNERIADNAVVGQLPELPRLNINLQQSGPKRRHHLKDGLLHALRCRQDNLLNLRAVTRRDTPRILAEPHRFRAQVNKRLFQLLKLLPRWRGGGEHKGLHLAREVFDGFRRILDDAVGLLASRREFFG